MSAIELLTKEDLHVFKEGLLRDIEALLIRYNQQKPKRWLKTYEVRKMLDLSAGTLQTMRNNGTISFSMIGNLAYYDYDEIVAMVEKNKRNRTPASLIKHGK